MAISPVNSQSVAQTSQTQKADQAEMAQNRPQMAPARSEDAYTVDISQEAQKMAQENAQQNSMVPENRKPSM